MPCLKLKLSIDLPATAKQALLRQASRQIADLLHKPEAYLMLVIETQQDLMMAASLEPAALAELYSIGGLDPDTNQRLSSALAGLLAPYGIAPERLYLMLFEVPASHFGWNATTFAE